MPMPANPVRVACGILARSNTSLPSAARAAVLNDAVNVFLNYTGTRTCHDVASELVGHPPRPAGGGGGGGASLGDISRPWNYQTCTELQLEPLTSDGDGFYTTADDQVGQLAAACALRFDGVRGRPGWMRASFGDGVDLARALTNVFFSDGEKDPWHVGR